MTDSPTGWFLRSMADKDTHRGTYSPATRSVHAVCGLEFVPRPIGLHGQHIALRGYPPDPDQVCLECCRHLPETHTPRR